MTYNIGDKVSHPGHGACVVKDICEKEFGSTSATYYVLSSMVERQTAIYVPVSKAEKLGLRTLITEAEADELMDSLEQADVPWIADRSKRQKMFDTLYADNTMDSLQDSMTALSAIVQRRKEKPLGSNEKNVLNTIQNKTLSEIALAKGISLAAAIEKAEKRILDLS